MTARIIGIGGALLCCLLSVRVGAAEVTFAEAWSRLLQQDEGLAAEREGVSRAQAMREAARDLYLPKIDVGASYTRLDQPVEMDMLDLNPMAGKRDLILALGRLFGVGASSFVTPLTEQNVVTSSVKMLWPLFVGGRIDAAQDIREAQVNEARELLAIKQQASFENLSQTYFGVVLARQVVQTRQEIEQGLAHHYDHARKLEAQGQIARVELLSAQSALDRARIETQKARRSLEIAELALSRLIKLDGAEPSNPLFVNQQTPPLAPLVTQTLAVHPGLKMLMAKREQAKGLIRVEQGKYAPEVFLYGNYNLYEQDTLAAKMAPDWLVGVGVSLPLVSRDGRSEMVAAAKSAELQVNHLEAKTRRDLELLVEKTWREAGQALEEYQSLSSTQQLAEENVKLRDKAFGQGLSTSLDVVDARNQLAGVKTQRAAAAYQYVVSLARLMALGGEIDQFRHYQQEQGIEVTQ
ncbi:TolC family protein [Aeromonas schubertii]|uniref:TolC family protein n=1 Tax=Aeromonas schubertii TaxID=652 RepID=UPI001CC390DE|nr:TolC family protein [Aeromonas schubertii]MBZ6074395.1 TolC family protein [Aeromonas schubertii]